MNKKILFLLTLFLLVNPLLGADKEPSETVADKQQSKTIDISQDLFIATVSACSDFLTKKVALSEKISGLVRAQLTEFNLKNLPIPMVKNLEGVNTELNSMHQTNAQTIQAVKKLAEKYTPLINPFNDVADQEADDVEMAWQDIPKVMEDGKVETKDRLNLITIGKLIKKQQKRANSSYKLMLKIKLIEDELKKHIDASTVTESHAENIIQKCFALFKNQKSLLPSFDELAPATAQSNASDNALMHQKMTHDDIQRYHNILNVNLILIGHLNEFVALLDTETLHSYQPELDEYHKIFSEKFNLLNEHDQQVEQKQPAASATATTGKDASIVCGSCSKTENLQRCGRCLTTHYCSKACQAKGWGKHKLVCRPLTFHMSTTTIKDSNGTIYKKTNSSRPDSLEIMHPTTGDRFKLIPDISAQSSVSFINEAKGTKYMVELDTSMTDLVEQIITKTGKQR